MTYCGRCLNVGRVENEYLLGQVRRADNGVSFHKLIGVTRVRQCNRHPVDRSLDKCQRPKRLEFTWFSDPQ